MRDPQNTPFPFPPQGDPFRRLPEATPWDEPISTMPEFWIETTCGNCGNTTKYPLRLMAAELGWDRTLRDIVPRLRCSRCKVPPATAFLVDDPAGETGRFGAKVGKLDLLG